MNNKSLNMKALLPGENSELKRLKDYWEKQLSGEFTLLELPASFPLYPLQAN